MTSYFTVDVQSESPEWEDLCNRLRRLIHQYAVLDRQRRWINLDPLWHAPEAFVPYTEIVTKYLRLTLGDNLPPQTMLIAADTLSSSFGILPAVAVAAHQLGCGLTIWKELGDLTWGISRFFPEPERDKTCVVVQYVVRWGTTILKIAADLESYNWHIRAYLSMVQVAQAESGLQATLRDLQNTGRTPSDFRFWALLRHDLTE